MAGSHYETLGIRMTATADDIKQAYRRLVKQHHPDTSQVESNRIRQINAAYEVLKHPDTRQDYDRQLHRTQRGIRYTPRKPQATVSDEAAAQQQWIKLVYTPLNQALSRILNSLKPELNALSADPFDPDLMGDFESYLEKSDQLLTKAKHLFRQRPNPSSFAGVAARLYYVLNHLEDALDELHYFTLNFDVRHLHTGQELFHRAKGLRAEAMAAFKSSHMI